jgi:Zn-dependent M28 family amino/carboxypeptidase
MSGKKGNKTAADYIKKRFDSFGLKTYYQKFPISRLNPGPNNETGDDFTNNIIAVLEGQQQDCIVVGAHMDHIGYGPSMSRDGGGKIHNGADDNGSGSTVVLEISEAMSKLSKPSYTYVFICFSAEEMGLIGSQYYVRNPIIPNKIKMMINFDMVGWYKGKTCMINGGSKINPIKTALESLRPKYTNLKYSLTNSTGGGSDHVPFSNAGIPSVFFFTGLTPVYHTANDDVDQIDFDGLTTIARLAFEMLTEVDKMPKKVINSTTYEKTDYPMIHDHGIGVEFPHNHDHNHKH